MPASSTPRQLQAGCNVSGYDNDVSGGGQVRAFLLSVHVLAAIVLIGPVTAAASLFPRYARQALAELPDRGGPDGVVRALHRISSGYALLAVAVPVFGIATAAQLHVLGQVWLLVAMVLTAAAAALLGLAILPGQRGVVAALDAPVSGTASAFSTTGLAAPDMPARDAPWAGPAPPRPRHVAEQLAGDLAGQVRRLSMLSGVFSLTWAVVVVLMIARPGSTTGI